MATQARSKSRTFWRIAISPREAGLDSHGSAVLHDIRELGLRQVKAVAFSRLFFLEGSLSEKEIRQVADALLADPITETFTIQRGGDDPGLPGSDYEAAIEVHLKGGVMDPVAASTLAAIGDLGLDASDLGISTGRLYRLQRVASADEAEFIARRLLANDCIEDIYITGFGRHDVRPDHLPVAPTREFKLRHVPIRELNDEQLARLSREGHLFLSLAEMRTIQKHYQELGRDPTDLELETFAQTWSEHCVHKTLKSAVRYQGHPFPASSRAAQKPVEAGEVVVEYENLLRDTVARATRDLIDAGRATWCLSVFKDNAGIIEFDDKFAVAFKVETHNHPSAIEPYGGSATGVGGCIRDILGCGLGAKPIANTDVFCVGTPDFPMELLPKGVLHPRRVLKGVVAGVRDYGNRMGIPTVNGAIVFDDRYLGNPLVFCGCVGLIPRDRIKKAPQAGDLVVVLGGRTGRDGIHGATFSSAELTDTHADEFSHAVQIGNAITEKQVTDALMRARDWKGKCLYTAITDCGAGGLSSAVGEMAEKLGAEVDLEKVTLKYAGLRYDEIWISEAQERMVLSVPPKNWEVLKSICDAENVEATVIGKFRDDGKLIVRYEGQTVGELDTEFLHNGIPRRSMEARWTPPPPPGIEHRPAGVYSRKPLRETAHDYREVLMAHLSDLNASSKEWVIRQYDHEVQGGSVIKALVGPGEGPSDAAVLRPRLDSRKAVVLANGICPEFSDLDPYWMAVAAVDEAVRNVVCVGGSLERTAILDNFCWGNCEDPQVMGALVRACQGCYDAATAYGVPFISGKDSLNNEFALDPADVQRLAGRIRLHRNRIRIPETLLISAMSVIEDADRCVTMDAKPAAGKPSRFLFVGLRAAQWPEVNIIEAVRLHETVSHLIRSGKVLAAHDCGQDGILPTLAEMAFAGQCGVYSYLPCNGDMIDPFEPVPCGYVLQTTQEQTEAVLSACGALSGVVAREIGRSRDEKRFFWKQADNWSAFTQQMQGESFDIDLESLSNAWRAPLKW